MQKKTVEGQIKRNKPLVTLEWVEAHTHVVANLGMKSHSRLHQQQCRQQPNCNTLQTLAKAPMFWQYLALQQVWTM